MRNTLLLAKAFYRQTFDKPFKYILFLAMPVISILFLFLLYSGGDSSSIIEVGFVNKDNSKLTEYIIENLENSSGYKLTILTSEEMKKSIVSESQDSVIVFENNNAVIKTIKNPALTMGLEYMLNDLIVNYLELIKISDISGEELDIIVKEFENISISVESEMVRDESVLLGEVGKRSIGFLLVFMMVQALTITTLLMKNRENRTYYRLKTTPVTETQYLAGNLLAGTVLLSIQLGTSLFAVSFFLDINMIKMLPILILFSISALSLGLLIVAISKDRRMANNLGTLIMTPFAMLGGCFWPVDFLPEFLQKVALFIPHYWTMNAVAKIVENMALQSIIVNLLILLAFSVLFILLFIFRLKTNRRLD